MYLFEALKKTLETLTGVGRLPAAEVDKCVHERKANEFLFEDDGRVPNNPALPFIYYRTPIELPDERDPAAAFEQLFDENGWGDAWRNDIYDYVHYHSSTHEVLGIARGHAKVRFGGDKGRVSSYARETSPSCPRALAIRLFRRATICSSWAPIRRRENTTNAPGARNSMRARCNRFPRCRFPQRTRCSVQMARCSTAGSRASANADLQYPNTPPAHAGHAPARPPCRLRR